MGGVKGCDPPTSDLLSPFRHLLTSSKDLTRVLICLWPLLPSIMLLRIWKGQRREGRSPDPSPLWVPLLPPIPPSLLLTSSLFSSSSSASRKSRVTGSRKLVV